MFRIQVPFIEVADPWFGSIWDRLTRLARGDRHVAYFYPQPNAGTFRYRVQNMIEALAQSDDRIGASWFCNADLPHVDAILERADVLVICHAKYSVDSAQLVAKARCLGKRVLYDIDDLVFDGRYVHLVLNYLDHPTREIDFDYWFADFARYGALMRLCDGVILTNDYLAERASEFSGLPTSVVPNFMNQAQLEHSARILADKRSSGFARDQRVHLGYFSGSPTHQRDFAVVEDALRDLLMSDSRLVLRVVGHLEPGPVLAPFADRIERFPLQNVLNLQRLMGEVEINLVPLQENAFTHCKSALKVFEAAAVGTISVASPTFTLQAAIRDGETGFVAPAQDWSDTLLRAIAALDHYQEMALAAAAAAWSRDVPEAQGPGLLRALFGDEI